MITVDEANTIIYNIERPYKELLCLMMDTGIRVGDALSLTRSALNARKIKESKTGKEKELNITEGLKTMLERMPTSNDRIFFSRKDETVLINRITVWRKIKSIAEKNGIKASPHSFRKLYAIEEYKKDYNIERLRFKMNHRDVYTTLRYLDIDFKALIERGRNLLELL